MKSVDVIFNNYKNDHVVVELLNSPRRNLGNIGICRFEYNPERACLPAKAGLNLPKRIIKLKFDTLSRWFDKIQPSFIHGYGYKKV
jgi:hypothetical protein